MGHVADLAVINKGIHQTTGEKCGRIGYGFTTAADKKVGTGL